MDQQELLPGLFRNEYGTLFQYSFNYSGLNILRMLRILLAIHFLVLQKHGRLKGVPDNPIAWLYTVARNKTKVISSIGIFSEKWSPEIKHTAQLTEEAEIDLSPKNISDSQLAMIFIVCNPAISEESQTAVCFAFALRIRHTGNCGCVFYLTTERSYLQKS